MKLKALFTALAALLIVATVGAQERDAKLLEKAQKNTEGMAKHVKIDDATKAKVLDIMYTREAASADLKVRKSSLNEEEAKKQNSAIYRAWVNGLRAAVPADQKEAFETWRKLPPSERNK